MAAPAHTKVGVGYNVQIAVDAKHKMIVEQAVTNDVLDVGWCNRSVSRLENGFGDPVAVRAPHTGRAKRIGPTAGGPMVQLVR